MTELNAGRSRTLARYDYACSFSPGNWAWEFARRNRALRAAAQAQGAPPQVRDTRRGVRLLALPAPDPAAEAWGLLYFPNPDHSVLSTEVFWSDDACPDKITVNVRRREPGEIDEIFEQSVQLCAVNHLVDGASREHLFVRGRACAIQMRCTGASLLSPEPLKMEFAIPGFSTLTDHHAALSRARRVYDLPPCGKPAWTRKALGLRNALVALDANEAGLSYRQTASLIYGAERAACAWSGPSLSMKSEMARLLSKGRRLRDGGYREMLTAPFPGS